MGTIRRDRCKLGIGLPWRRLSMKCSSDVSVAGGGKEAGASKPKQPKLRGEVAREEEKVAGGGAI